MTSTTGQLELDSARRRCLQSWSRAAGGFGVLSGVLALVGWRFDIVVLKSYLPGQAPINPLTALAFIVAGVALWLLADEPAHRSRRAPSRLARLCGVLVALAGLLPLGSIVLGWNTGIDQVLFRDQLGAGASSLPYRMATDTAVALLLLGLALLVLDLRNRWGVRPAQVLALLVSWLAMLALAGYLYGTRPLSIFASFSPMPLPTASTLVVLALGVLSARPAHGLVAVATSDSMGGIVARRLLPAALLPLVVGWLSLRGQFAGFYAEQVGVAAVAMLNVLVFVALVGWNARMLHRMDIVQRRNAETLRKTTAAAEQAKELAEQAKQEIEEKAEQLALASKYKSEFLANMSHELRTPLNSLLILSQQLEKNAEGNLTPKQVEYAGTIQSAGADLLVLINDILDLAKIESGTVSLDIEELSCADLAGAMERSFRHVANSRDVQFRVELAPGLPRTMFTDRQRLQQVLKNLLANAFKFTKQGQVTLRIAPAGAAWSPYRKTFDRDGAALAFSVSDTGIGIPRDKQQLIFEAFQQADGSTSRKYGGTGLGLSISREIASLLGGEIHLDSTPGKGTTFTLFLPQSMQSSVALDEEVCRGFDNAHDGAEAPASREPASSADSLIDDDRATIGPADRVLLIVEDDPTFARILLELARDNGFRGVVATRGDSGLALARELSPTAISLDIYLPDIDGWHVLDRLKDDPQTRHIPVHIISVEDELRRALRQGAVACLTKPVSKEALDQALVAMLRLAERPVKTLLVVEDNDVERAGIVELLRGDDIDLIAVATAAAALAALEDARFDCLVLDLGLPDMSGFDLVAEIRKQPELRALPIVVYTGKDLTRQEEEQLTPVTRSVILKGAQSLQRLRDEAGLFLHRIAEVPPRSPAAPDSRTQDNPLAGRRVLLVDDDMRNIFSLTGVLERDEMEVLSADTALEGIALLEREPGIDIVLMDLMMPEMDGYEAIGAIRNLPQFKDLPIIAVTAKAMKGDREKCLAAGASDYLTKPIDLEQLRWLLGRWLAEQVEDQA